MRAFASISKNTAWFIVALFAGGTCIWLFKQASDDNWLPAIASAIIVIALSIYYISNDEDTPEEKSDNVYYLGLLYTLISLISTLIQLFGPEKAEALSKEDLHLLLQNFGIALTSTVAGIFGRILVLNWRKRASEREGLVGSQHFAKLGTSPSVANSGRYGNDMYLTLHELTRTVNALARVHHIVRQYASDTQSLMHDHSEALRKDSLSFRKFLEDNCQAFTNAFQNNAEKFSQEIKGQSRATLETVGDSFSSIARNSESHIAQVQSDQETYLRQLHHMTREFHDDLQATIKASIKTIEQNLGSAASQFDSLINAGTSSHDQINTTLSNMESSLQQNLLALEMLCKITGKTTNSVTALERELEKAGNSLTMVRTVSESMKVSFDNLSKLETEANEQASISANLHDTLADSIRAMDREIQEVTKSLGSLADETKSRLENLDKTRKWWEFGRK
ncbi:MAG: hypothetical protein F4X92_03735 [Gammaproteobacteria bacterium]|nr:hypothetical protein [Gammaproteobacteria bacterium]